MSYIVTSEVKTLNKKSSEDDGTKLLNSPAYREKYKERFYEAQKKVMDMVQFCDGTIVLIENKIAMYYYTWHSKKMEFERKKQQTVTKTNDLV